MQLALVGLSHATADIELREKAALDGREVVQALKLLHARPEVSGSLVLSTCGRSELYLSGLHLGALEQAARQTLAAVHGDRYADYAPHLRARSGRPAARHLFRVAAGLESLLLGEAQVLGQVRAAAADARRQRALDALLGGTVDQAVAGARAARTASGIGRGAVSVGEAAAAIVRETGGRRVLVVGAGEVGELVAKALARARLEMLVVSRGGVSARGLAERHGARALEAAEAESALREVDVIVCAARGRQPIVTPDRLAGRTSPLLVIDLAVPRAVEPEVGRLPGVVLVGLDELSRRVSASLRTRAEAAAAAEAVIEARLDAWEAWFRAQAVRPTLSAMARYADQIRVEELARALRGLKGLDPEVGARVEALSRSLVAKLMLHPIGYLRSHPDDRAAAELIERIFARPDA